MSTPPYLPLSPPLFSPPKWTEIVAHLGPITPDHCPFLRERLQNVASSYRSRVLQRVNGPTRKDDKAVYSEMTKLAAEASVIVRSLEDDQIAALGSLPELPVCLRAGPQNERLKAMSIVIGEVAAQAECETDTPVGSLTKKLKPLSQLLHSLEGATRFSPGMLPSEMVLPPTHSDDLETFAIQLDAIAATGERAHNMYRAKRGPARRTDLMLFAEDLFDAVEEARGIPLKLYVREDHHNGDAKFVRAFADWAHGLIPEDIRDANGHIFLPHAILDAVKERSERVNKMRR